MTNIEDRVKKIVAEQLGVSLNDVKGSSDIVNDLGGDSLDQIELIMAIEDEFSLEIPDAEGEKIQTVQQIIDYVTGRAAA